MSNIKVLENSMINKIAAGEVVERPLSVIKELVENSIDAGASEITVEIRDGGTSYMRVADNGRGIASEQVRTAFLRHATSKIENVDDLESVMTMGFRGEALSSIAAVSRVELITKTAEAVTGTRIEINGGEVISEGETGTTAGTSIGVRNLFYNVPARRKFLKKPSTEGGYISDIINRLAMGNPDIAFKYINNNSVMLQTKGDGDLKTVMFQIYGKEVCASLIELRYNKSGVGIGGYVGKPSVSRGNRGYSLLYINGRYIKSELVQSAIEDAFKTKLMQNKFPLSVMRLSLDPRLIDVNVHPTKLEVRFSDESLVYKSVYDAVNTALKSESLVPAVLAEKSKPPARTEDTAKLSSFIYDTLPKAIERSEEPATGGVMFLSEDTVQSAIEPEGERRTAFFKNYRIIGQVFYTYWLIEQDSSVYLIDQHAAHERVLYEKLTDSLKSGKVDSQRLVQPVIIPVNQTERERLRENRDFFEECGFDIEEFDQSSFVLYSVPFILGSPAGAEFFIEILDRLGAIDKNADNLYDTKLNTVATISCKAAVKANDRLSHVEARGLIEQILKLSDPFTCPHGRPTVIELSKTELEKMFKRVQP